MSHSYVYVPNDVVVIELLQETDFSNSSTGYTFIFSFQPDLLKCHQFSSLDLASLVDYTVCT